MGHHHDSPFHDRSKHHDHPPKHRSRYYSGRYGYGYHRPGFSIYLGTPLYRYYDYSYIAPYYYRPYYDFYYVVPSTVVQSVVVEPEPVLVQNGAMIPAATDAVQYQLEAEQAFRSHDYEEAAQLSNHAIVEDGENGKLHLFAAQVLFALGDYPSAAAAIQQAASLLDESEWGFVVENYQKFYRGTDYVTQMNELNSYIEANPDAAYAHFLRGYHFYYLGHPEAARADLAKAFELEPRDRLAAGLLKKAGGTVPEAVPVLPPEAEVIPPPEAEEP